MVIITKQEQHFTSWLDFEGKPFFEMPLLDDFSQIMNDCYQHISNSSQIVQQWEMEKFVLNDIDQQQRNIEEQCSNVQQQNEKQIKTDYKKDLHNCPKALIRFIIDCFDASKIDSFQSFQFVSLKEQVKEHIKDLINIFQQCGKGQVKSYSKQILKIIFQQQSQTLQKLRLLRNPFIKCIFQKVNNKQDMNTAKSILREFTIQILEQKRQLFLNRSKNKKQVNEKYLLLFVNQLKKGKVKERISKEDKKWIFNQ